MKKTVNGHFLFRLQYNCPVFPSNIQDRRRSGQRFFDILIFIAEMIFSVSRNSPMGDYQNILLTGEHPEPIGTIRMLAYGPTQKSPPFVQAVFQVAPAQISSRLLYPRPPLSLSAPNQNRQATQAIKNYSKDFFTIIFTSSVLVIVATTAAPARYIVLLLLV